MELSRGPKYCSVTETMKNPRRDGAASPCPFAWREPWLPWHHSLTRCGSAHPCLHVKDPAWQGPGRLEGAEGAAGTWVLARREPDGFYYRAQIKAAPELERKGALVVEFEAPLASSPSLPAQQQSVVFKEDVIQLSPSVEHSLQPGDKVLAPWEPEQQQYGPGTVLLGLKAKHPQRASKEEEITIYFWNGMTAKVPVGRVRWVPSPVWKKAVERLQLLHASEGPCPLFWAPCCSPPRPVTGCLTHRPPLHTPFLCPPCHPHARCQLPCQGCLCCCPLVGPPWWPLAPTSEVTARELPEPEVKPTAQRLTLEGPEEEVLAALTPFAASSSSSSCEEDNLEKDLELPPRQMVNSAVNTDPIFPETLPRHSGSRRPDWRYWRRNGPEPCPGRPGTRCCHIQKKEKDNDQDRVHIAVAGTTQEPVQKATKKPQQPLLGAKHRTPSRSITIHQRSKNSP